VVKGRLCGRMVKKLKLLRVILGRELRLASMKVLLMSFAIIVGCLSIISQIVRNTWCASYVRRKIILWKVVQLELRAILVLNI
jgi:hypothetical protein